MGKPTAKQEVSEYSMSIHLGVGEGPMDAITGLFVGEKLAWSGEVTDEGAITVSSPQLFGGPKEGGGVSGRMYYLPGLATQVLPNDLALKQSLTSDTSPGYRGIMSVFFDRFVWTSNSPFVQTIWIRARRAPRTDAALGDPVIALEDYKNANPSHMIYECLTDSSWGMGVLASSIDLGSFAYAAGVFRTENLGLFIFWDRQSTIEDFIGSVLDHCLSVLYLNPLTGLWTLTPMRGDYDPADLEQYNPDNCEISDFDRKLISETVNEVTVTWTNPASEQPETVTIQDLANIEQQDGQIVSLPRNYYGFRSATVASARAAQDLRAAAAPLAACTMKAFRQGWKLVPGGCLRLTWPEENVDNLVMRVQRVEYGTASDGYVTVTLLEDVFALDAPDYTGDQGSDWEDPAAAPNAISHILLTTAPTYVVANYLDDTPVEPEVNTLLLAADPNTDFRNYEAYADLVLSNGSTVSRTTGTLTPAGYNTLPVDLVQASTSTVTFTGQQPNVADLVFIGDDEICLVQEVNTDGSVDLKRGVLDTVPLSWTAGTGVWFLSADDNVLDDTLRAPGEAVTYNLRMRTSLGLAPSTVPDSHVTLTDRPYLPLRPANVTVNGVFWGTVDLTGVDADVEWSTRNRLMETTIILGWRDASVPPENDQSVLIEVIDNHGDVVRSFDGLIGTSYTVASADLAGGVALKVWSVNGDGDKSYTAHQIRYTR